MKISEQTEQLVEKLQVCTFLRLIPVPFATTRLILIVVKQPFHPARPQNNIRSPFQVEAMSGKSQLRTNILQSRGSSTSQAFPLVSHPRTPELLSSGARSRLDALEQQQEEREHGITLDSSVPSLASSANSSPDNLPRLRPRVGLGIDIDEKPLPKIPSIQELDKSECSPRVNKFGSSNFAPFEASSNNLEMSSFSFKPGDDTDILAQSMAKNFKLKSAAASMAHQPRSINSQEQIERMHIIGPNGDGSKPPKHKAKVYGKPGRDPQEYEALKRDDSNSSIITQVRVDSRRSSVDSSRHSSQDTRQRLNRNSGSNEAVTAAVRALASASTSVRNSPRKGSSAGTREGSSKGEESPRIDEKDESSGQVN